MLLRFNLSRHGLLVFGFTMLLGLATTQRSDAAPVSPSTLKSPVASTLASPVHCKKHRHFHKRCRYCRREYHTCQKKKK